MADGRLGKCKDCAKSDIKINREVRKGYYREYDHKRWRTNRAYRMAHRKPAQKWRDNNKDKCRNAYYKYNFGITLKQYEKMLEMGNGGCWICGRPPGKRRLAVEHSHKKPDKGRVRGLACHNCNQYLIGKNTVETAKKILAYLESPFDGRNL